MEANKEVCMSVNDDMRQASHKYTYIFFFFFFLNKDQILNCKYFRKEIKTLKKALKVEYLRNGEQMPEQMKEKTQKAKRPRKLKIKQTDNNIFDKLTVNIIII